MNRALRGAALLTVVGLAFASGWGIHSSATPAPAHSRQPQAGAQPSAAVEVETVPVARQALALTAEATGYLQAWRKVEVHAEIAGRVVRRSVEEGAQVGAGQPLFLLDDRDRVIDLKDAEAAWLKTQAAYAVDFSRDAGEPASGSLQPTGSPADAERLYSEGLISSGKLEEMRRGAESAKLLSGDRRSEVRAAQSGLTQSEQQVERCRIALQRTRIEAPFAGRVADLNAEVGKQVSPGESLLTLLEDDRLKVEVDVLEADLVWLHPGAPAKVLIPSIGNTILQGVVATVNPMVKTATGTGKVTVAIANPSHRLLAGLFATVRLETRRIPDQLVVPARAVLVRQGRELVFRIENDKALWTYVTVGEKTGDFVAIREGLHEGDVVAVGGHFALAHGASVSTIPAKAQPAGGLGPQGSWSP